MTRRRAGSKEFHPASGRAVRHACSVIILAVADDIIARKNELHRRLHDQARLLAKLQNERQSASSAAARDRYDRDTRVVTEEIRRLNAELVGLKDETKP